MSKILKTKLSDRVPGLVMFLDGTEHYKAQLGYDDATGDIHLYIMARGLRTPAPPWEYAVMSKELRRLENYFSSNFITFVEFWKNIEKRGCIAYDCDFVSSSEESGTGTR